MIDVVLKPYEVEFARSENATLENVDKRYTWIARRMKDVEGLYEGVFPHYWGLKCFLYHEFAGMTRIQITNILESRPVSDVLILLKALQATLKFESKTSSTLGKEFGSYVDDANKEDKEVKDELEEELSDDKSRSDSQSHFVDEESKEFVITTLPKFRGSISSCFEFYMKPYVDKEEAEVKENIMKVFPNDSNVDQQTEIFESSVVMFNNFSAVIKRASQYSRTQTMVEIWHVFRRVMKFYYDELLQRLNKEAQKITNDRGFEQTCCLMANTGDYCKETLPKLVQAIKEKTDTPFSEEIQPKSEEERFTDITNRGMGGALGLMQIRLDPFFG
jgi:hypothetical protein